MAIFSRNPLDTPWTTKRKVSLLFYVLFFAASVWASGESFYRSLGQAKVFCYVLAFIVLALASFCLGMVKESLSRGYVKTRSVKLIAGLMGFIVGWVIILMANTHNVYYIMTKDEQQQKELRNVKNQLELVEDKSITAFKSAKTKFSKDVEGEIANLKEELLNPNNQGHGEKTEQIVTRIETLLGQEVDLPTKPPTDLPGLRQYSTNLADKIREITKGKLSVVDEKINQLESFLQKEDYQNVQKNLDDLIANYDLRSDRDITKGLRDSYSMYAKTQEYIDQLYSEPLIKENANLPLQKLPEVPVSIEAGDIAFVWGQFFKGELPSLSRFIWSIVIGLSFDLACFLFWYFGVLSEDE